jgi:hypothetical protein
MTLRLFCRVRIVPGLRLNLSKSGASVSIGHRGAWYTVGPKGRRVTASLPGTGFVVHTIHQAPTARRAYAAELVIPRRLGMAARGPRHCRDRVVARVSGE